MRYSTKAERKLIYELLIQRIDNGDMFTLCPTILGLVTFHLVSLDIENVIPELAAVRTDLPGMQWGMMWFPLTVKGMEKRKQLLLKAIELCDAPD